MGKTSLVISVEILLQVQTFFGERRAVRSEVVRQAIDDALRVLDYFA